MTPSDTTANEGTAAPAEGEATVTNGDTFDDVTEKELADEAVREGDAGSVEPMASEDTRIDEDATAAEPTAEEQAEQAEDDAAREAVGTADNVEEDDAEFEGDEDLNEALEVIHGVATGRLSREDARNYLAESHPDFVPVAGD